MTPRLALIWKEWNEDFVFLVVGIFIFLVMPVIGGVEDFRNGQQRLMIYPTTWLTCGSVFAVFVAAGSACRDFGGRLEDFWRSRPVRIEEWSGIKFLVGLFMVQFTCVVPLLVQHAINGEKAADNPLVMAIWYPFLWTAAYSIGFLCGSIVHRVAHAVMLALGALLLLYFLPSLVPPLHWMGLSRVDNLITDSSLNSGRPPVEFAVGMIIVSLVLLAGAILAVKLDWHVEAGPKLLFGSISVAALILLSTAAYQLGTNMPVLQQADFPPQRYTSSMRLDKFSGYVVTFIRKNEGVAQTEYQTVDVAGTDIHLGRPIPTDRDFPSDDGIYSAPGHPDILYHVDYSDVPAQGNGNDISEENTRAILNLMVSQMPRGDKLVYKIWEGLKSSNNDHPYYSVHVHDQRLYLIVADRLITFDISDPFSPRTISNQPIRVGRVFGRFGLDKFTLLFTDFPHLSKEEKLKVQMQGLCFDNPWLCGAEGGRNDGTLFIYKLTRLTDDGVEFVKTAQYTPSFLEKSPEGSWWPFWNNGVQLHSSRLYLFWPESGLLNPHISVFDIAGPGPVHVVGHFSAPGIEAFRILPDGNVLVGGSKLWLVGPPPHREVN